MPIKPQRFLLALKGGIMQDVRMQTFPQSSLKLCSHCADIHFDKTWAESTRTTHHNVSIIMH